MDSDSHRLSFCHSISNTNTYCFHSYGYSYPDFYTHSDRDARGRVYVDSHTNRFTHTYSDAHAHCRYPHADAYPYGNTLAYRYANPYIDPNANDYQWLKIGFLRLH